MKFIPLPNGLSAIVDDEDYELLSSMKWRATKRRGATQYVRTGWGKDTQSMHSVVCDCPKGMVIDHINGNGLDNRRANLRAVPPSINRLSSKVSKNNSSGYRGVSFHKTSRKWVSRLGRRVNGELVFEYFG